MHMSNELGKIDVIRERTGATYREAKQALEEAGGDVVQALINLEEGAKDCGAKDFAGQKVFGQNVFGHELMDNIKDVLQRGQTTRIRIKQGDRTVFEVPASVGAVGILAALASSELALLGALGSVAAMSKKYTLEFDRTNKNEKEEVGVEANEIKETFTFKNDQLQ